MRVRVWLRRGCAPAVLAGLLTSVALAADPPPQRINLSLDAASNPAEYHLRDGSNGYERIDQILAHPGGPQSSIFFSVDRLTRGMSGSTVNQEAIIPVESAWADIYEFDRSGPQPQVNIFKQEAQLGLATGFFGDDIDGLQLDLTPQQVSINASFAFAAIWRNSSMMGTPVTPNGGGPAQPLGPGDILMTSLGQLFASRAQLGLQPGDALDSLILMDVDPDGQTESEYYTPNRVLDAGLDMAIFSLDPFSPSVQSGQFSAATLFITSFDGTHQLFLDPATLGLTASDNVDALSMVPEPSSLGLLAGCAALLAALRRNKGGDR